MLGRRERRGPTKNPKINEWGGTIVWNRRVLMLIILDYMAPVSKETKIEGNNKEASPSVGKKVLV